MERHEKYIEILEAQIGFHHSALVSLVKQCLNNVPDKRPTAEDLLTRLQGMRVQIEGEFCTSPVKLDLASLRLTKVMSTKDRKIEELLQVQVKKKHRELIPCSEDMGKD